MLARSQKNKLHLLLQWKLTENEYKLCKVADKTTFSNEELKPLRNEFRDQEVPDVELPPVDKEVIQIQKLKKQN